MKILLTTACLGLSLVAGTAHAASDLEVLERKVKPFASTELDEYEHPCICTEPGSENEGLAGRLRYAVLTQPHRVRVWCQISIYGYDGHPASSVGCNTFQPFSS